MESQISKIDFKYANNYSQKGVEKCVKTIGVRYLQGNQETSETVRGFPGVWIPGRILLRETAYWMIENTGQVLFKRCRKGPETQSYGPWRGYFKLKAKNFKKNHRLLFVINLKESDSNWKQVGWFRTNSSSRKKDFLPILRIANNLTIWFLENCFQSLYRIAYLIIIYY